MASSVQGWSRRSNSGREHSKAARGMAKYYFNLRGGSADVEAEEGFEFANHAAARNAAVKEARSLIAADILNGILDLTSRIEVTDEQGNLLFSLPFEAAIGQR